MANGVNFSKILNNVVPGSIDLKKIDMNPNNDFKKNINNNANIEACKNIKLKTIGVGGPDITKGDKKAILAVIWQLTRQHYLKIIGGKTEEQLVEGANERVGGKHTHIANLKDQSLKDSKYLMHLCASIEPRAVNWEIMSDGDT